MDRMGYPYMVYSGSGICLLDRSKPLATGLFQSQVVPKPVRRLSQGEAGHHTVSLLVRISEDYCVDFGFFIVVSGALDKTIGICAEA